jgi:hypothetical protein
MHSPQIYTLAFQAAFFSEVLLPSFCADVKLGLSQDSSFLGCDAVCWVSSSDISK